MSETNHVTDHVKPRLEWLDIAKGLGVLLVLLGHLWYHCLFPVVNQMIYSFHMPMFFILSGFVFKKGNSKFGSFLVSKIKRLLVPTFFFFVIGAAVLVCLKRPPSEILMGFFFVNGTCPYNDPCWYFIALFQLLVISYFLNLDKLSYPKMILSIVTALTAGFLLYEFEIDIPFGISRTIVAFVFFALGALLKRAYCDGKAIKRSGYKLLAIVCCIALWFLCGVVLNEKVSFYLMEIGNYFFFVIAGICGSIAFIELCKLLEKTRIKSFFIRTAQNSIIIIGTHYVLKSMLAAVAKKFDLINTWQYTLIAICFAIVVTLIYNFLGGWLDKYLPAMTGKMK